MAEHITLEAKDDDDGMVLRRLIVHDDGSLVLEGHDLGPGVERFWGRGNTEYEFSRTVAPDGVRHLRAVLEIDDTDPDALAAALRERFARPGGSPDFEKTLVANDITSEFWSRVGS